MKLRVKDLQNYLCRNKINIKSCVEKKDLVELVLQTNGDSSATTVGGSENRDESRPRVATSNSWQDNTIRVSDQVPLERPSNFPQSYVESTHRREFFERFSTLPEDSGRLLEPDLADDSIMKDATSPDIITIKDSPETTCDEVNKDTTETVTGGDETDRILPFLQDEEMLQVKEDHFSDNSPGDEVTAVEVIEENVTIVQNIEEDESIGVDTENNLLSSQNNTKQDQQSRQDETSQSTSTDSHRASSSQHSDRSTRQTSDRTPGQTSDRSPKQTSDTSEHRSGRGRVDIPRLLSNDDIIEVSVIPDSTSDSEPIIVTQSVDETQQDEQTSGQSNRKDSGSSKDKSSPNVSGATSKKLKPDLLPETSTSLPSSPRRFANQGVVYLSEIQSEEDFKDLSAKQVKEILAMNRVNFKGCVEKEELLKIVERLWKEEQRNKQGLDTMLDDSLCKICMDAAIDCVMLECGHMCTCTNCGKQMAECPICRQYVVRVVRTFKS